jgi:NADH-quinone oxidoreductase subunit L
MRLVGLIPFFPFLGFIIIGLGGRWVPKKVVSLLAPGLVGLSFLTTLSIFFALFGLEPLNRSVVYSYFPWIEAGSFKVDVSFLIDPLSMVMALVVTGVGFLIHVYSTGYMQDDAGYKRYFAYLNLFTFSMLILVLGSNFLVMFLGWEGVGLCSYLLIGFWYEKKSASDAGKKAFIVNRIGDFGFVLGMMLIFTAFGSLDYKTVFSNASGLLLPGGTIATAIALLLFLGATGKSAQIPLYTWLPDAMEGPTPVSALIHAATMVTAGVYMVARCYALFVLAPFAMAVVAVVGILTAMMAASIGLVQNDIKRVLAYSTISQLGYMFLACGVGAFSAGIFHLVTHAFFKALLFLGAGSVIHALSGEQDLRRMGGLRKYLPMTYITFLVATLAISGVPLLSGFFSKDQILSAAFFSPHGGKILWLMGIATAAMTAFYMFRLFFLAFTGRCRAPEEVQHHIHESPRSMTIPLMVLGFLSVIGGYIGMPHALGGANAIVGYLSPVFSGLPHEVEPPLGMEYLLMVTAVIVAVLGISLAYFFYLRSPQAAERLKQGVLYTVLLNKYYVDEIYQALIVAPLIAASRWTWQKFDLGVIDGAVNGSARLVDLLARRCRNLQTGYVRQYAMSVVFGAAAILAYLVWVM